MFNVQDIINKDPKAGVNDKRSMSRKNYVPATVEDARKSAVDLIQKNLDYIKGIITDKPNTLVNPLPGETYQVGAKYSNTWLTKWIENEGGKMGSFVEVSEEFVPEVLERMQQAINDGAADEQLEAIIKKNLELRRKNRRVN